MRRCAVVGLPILLCLAVALTSGCQAHTHIPATELPRLNGMSTQAATYGNVTLVRQTVQHVRRTDGTMAQIVGDFGATVVPRDRSLTAVSFGSPVSASTDAFNLRVAGGNRPETAFPLGEIDFVDISTYDAGLTTLLTTLISLGVGGIAIAITFALIF
jgi:hypothetical protein